MHCPVVRIKSTHPESQGAFVEVNESDFDPEKHELYIAPAEGPLAPPLPPPPPPPSADPLAGLTADWRERKAVELRNIAAAVSGRTPANKEESVQMIEAALAARG